MDALEILVSNDEVARVNALLGGQAARVGLNLDVVQGNKDTYFSDIRDNGVVATYRSGALPIEAHISQRLLSYSSTNFTKWARPEFDALYAQAQSTGDDAHRGELYLRMQEQLHAEGGFLIWGFADFLVGSLPQLGGVDPSAPANTLDWARFDKVWLT